MRGSRGRREGIWRRWSVLLRGGLLPASRDGGRCPSSRSRVSRLGHDSLPFQSASILTHFFNLQSVGYFSLTLATLPSDRPIPVRPALSGCRGLSEPLLFGTNRIYHCCISESASAASRTSRFARRAFSPPSCDQRAFHVANEPTNMRGYRL
jgi:hypothetical protein